MTAPDEKLEKQLKRRAMVQHRPDLAERIILAASAMPQRQSVNISTWLARLFGEFLLPRPAYAISLVLLLGVLVGFASPGEETVQEAAYVQEFLYENGSE